MRACFAFLLFLIPTQAFAMAQMPSHTQASFEGKQAPDLVLEKNTGQKASIMSARNGQKAILIFWATWCPHCKEELARIKELLPLFKTQGIQVILVDVGETKDEVNAYIEHAQLPLESFVDEENALQEPYHIEGIPSVFLIDAKGTIRYHDYGLPDNYLELLK